MLQALSRRGVRALSTSAYVLPEFNVLFEDIKADAAKNKLIKVSKLTNLFKTAASKADLELSTEALKIYERKHIDPIEVTAGEFVKACIQHDAADVAVSALSQNRRIGLFVNAGSLNKLLVHFKNAQDDANLIAVFDEAKKFDIRYNPVSYHLAISAHLRSGDVEKALAVLESAAAAKKIDSKTVNHVLFQLTKSEAGDQVETVVALLKKHNVALDESGAKLASA
ncbi:hypothetical protein SDRG_03390 [Saprolegnia diclina VS20]|uniref:Pentacotripeptide-repeat region of PRORP domain-containing protein n=1 Tax=Saprolegnia diclina (strain VS20) TaxID=1156394 RepID=T0QM73_SAPDV|nr:hypothetical protein SDRG_03390 [Saprolegnia diclina VS20]EQC39184.1 hypothetical protein SDRG_03390 [Saprolegnia diclina VS20]|eukprot:XP_008607245.1 hypothetical protein SDRG_03390 [Saprolegnia diclina VS20]